MKLTTLLENALDADRTDVRWAVDDNADKAQDWMNRKINDPHRVVVWVNIRDLFKHTDSDQQMDINDPTGGRNSIGRRVENAKSHWFRGGYMDPSDIYVNQDGKVHFTDGRHRLVAAYQLGHRYAPVIIDDTEGSYQNFLKAGIRVRNPD